MPIIQINVWICEKCGATETTSEATGMYDDPIVHPPKKAGATWDHVELGPDKYPLLCPKCQAALAADAAGKDEASG
jgi:ribosomal protein L40E